VQGSGIANRGLQAPRGAGRPHEAVGNAKQSDRLGAVLTLIVTGLARTWTKPSGEPGATLATPTSAVLQPTSEEITWKL
jgi:hypothetical protein